MNINHNPNLKALVTSVFNDADPQGLIRMGAPPDEYDSEIIDIMAQMSFMKDIDSTCEVIYNVFYKWFGQDITGTRIVYRPLAVALFNVLRDEELI